MLTNDVPVRRAGRDDIASIAVLFNAYRQFYDMASDLSGAESYLRARINGDESVIFFAEQENGAVAGFCQLYPAFCSVFMARIFTLYDLFVLPEARKSGCARALLAAAKKFAMEQGAVRLELRTAKTNLPAQALYESSGWRRDEKFYSYSLSCINK